jgi:hypothetical protein
MNYFTVILSILKRERDIANVSDRSAFLTVSERFMDGLKRSKTFTNSYGRLKINIIYFGIRKVMKRAEQFSI